MVLGGKTLFRFVVFASGVAAAYGLCDLIFSWNPLAAAPFFAHRTNPVFRAEPLLFLGGLAEIVNGYVCALSFCLVQASLPGTTLRRGLLFGLVIFGFWVLSGTFSAAVWLNLPPGLIAANIAFGFPKCLAIGAVTSFLWSFYGR